MERPSRPKKILILTSSVGSGHLSIAEAYKQIIKYNLPKSEVMIANTSKDAVSWSYRFVTSYLGKTYLRLWNYTNTENFSRLFHKIQVFMTKDKVLKLVKDFDPDLIISTNAYSASPAHWVLKKLEKKIPIIVVVADPFSLHATWTTFKEGDLYLSPTIESQKILVKSGIKGAKIRITGWPVRKTFYQKYNKKKLKRKQILITSGGEGLSYVRSYIIEALKKKEIRQECLLNIVCARNKELFLSIKVLQKLYPNSINVFEFVKDIHRLMQDSDLIVGKPGPNFLFEAITLGKPFIAIGEPIGQEAGNYEFIEKNKIGHYFKKPKNFQKFLISFIEGRKTDIDEVKLKNLSELQKETPEKIWNALEPYLN